MVQKQLAVVDRLVKIVCSSLLDRQEASTLTLLTQTDLPCMRANRPGKPEKRLETALSFCMGLPIGLSIPAWTARPDVHCIGTMVGIFTSMMGIFMILQSIFAYPGFSYPLYVASLFAGNNLARSRLAFAVVLFDRPLYENVGIGLGTSLLGGLTAGCVIGIYVPWYYSDRLRARSNFASDLEWQD